MYGKTQLKLLNDMVSNFAHGPQSGAAKVLRSPMTERVP